MGTIVNEILLMLIYGVGFLAGCGLLNYCSARKSKDLFEFLILTATCVICFLYVTPRWGGPEQILLERVTFVVWLVFCGFLGVRKNVSKNNQGKSNQGKSSTKSQPVKKPEPAKPVSTTKVPGKSTSISGVTKKPSGYNQGTSFDESRIKREFLGKTTELTKRLVGLFRDLYLPSWATKQSSYDAGIIRTIFVGKKDFYIYASEPPLEISRNGVVVGETWPYDSILVCGTWIKCHFYKISYPDDLGLAPLKNYKDQLSGRTISEKEIVGWLTENYITELKKNFPVFQISEMKLVERGDDFYYYFTYTVPQKQAKSLY